MILFIICLVVCIVVQGVLLCCDERNMKLLDAEVARLQREIGEAGVDLRRSDAAIVTLKEQLKKYDPHHRPRDASGRFVAD